MAWAKNGTPDTLTATGDDVTISDLTSVTFNFFIWNVLPTGTGNHDVMRVGNDSIDSSSTYATRYSGNGGTDATFVSQTRGLIGYNGDTDNDLGIAFGINIDSEEKLFITNVSNGGTSTGAATVPSREVAVFKWTNTTDQYNQSQILQESGSGDWEADSNLSALGTD